MSLISVHRSPSPTAETAAEEHADAGCTPSSALSTATSLDVEADDVRTESSATTTNGAAGGGKSRSLSECYFTVKGAAVILSHSDQSCVVRPRSGQPTQGSA